MTDLPVMPILFMTKYSAGREKVAQTTLESIIANMQYSYGYKLYIADGSDFDEHSMRLEELWARMTGGLAVTTRLNNAPGVVWNAALVKMFMDGHQWYYRSEDDFVLREKIDITPYARLLTERQDVGMVRLGLMPIGLDLHSVGFIDSTGHPGIYFNCSATTSYAYSGNPGIVHKRLHDAVGWFHESHNPGDIEIDFDYRVREAMKKGGPHIWMPFALGGETRTYGVYSHIGEVKSYE